MQDYGRIIAIVKHIDANRRVADVYFNSDIDTLFIIGKLEPGQQAVSLLSFDRSGNLAIRRDGGLIPMKEKIDYTRYNTEGDPTYFEFELGYGEGEWLKVCHMLPPTSQCIEKSPYISAEVLVSRHLLSTPSFVAFLKS